MLGGRKIQAKYRLTADFLKSPQPGKYCDGAGLWLVVREDGGAQWVLRVTVHGRRREMGLGGYPEIGLAAVRDLAERWRAMAKQGRDPIKERAAEERAARREDITLAILVPLKPPFMLNAQETSAPHITVFSGTETQARQQILCATRPYALSAAPPLKPLQSDPC